MQKILSFDSKLYLLLGIFLHHVVAESRSPEINIFFQCSLHETSPKLMNERKKTRLAAPRRRQKPFYCLKQKGGLEHPEKRNCSPRSRLISMKM
jgi:hypothetical protein